MSGREEIRAGTLRVGETSDGEWWARLEEVGGDDVEGLTDLPSGEYPVFVRPNDGGGGGGGGCCCSCAEPEHRREDYAERCHKCGKHRAPKGRVRWVDPPAEEEER